MNRVLTIDEEYLTEEDGSTICDDFDIQYYHEDDGDKIFLFEQSNPDSYEEARIRFEYATELEEDLDNELDNTYLTETI